MSAADRDFKFFESPNRTQGPFWKSKQIYCFRTAVGFRNKISIWTWSSPNQSTFFQQKAVLFPKQSVKSPNSSEILNEPKKSQQAEGPEWLFGSQTPPSVSHLFSFFQKVFYSDCPPPFIFSSRTLQIFHPFEDNFYAVIFKPIFPPPTHGGQMIQCQKVGF